MTKAVLLFGVALVLFVQGCSSCDPDESVSIRMIAGNDLNSYDGEAHKLDVYIFKLADPAAFQSTPTNQLKGENQQVPGGIRLGRKNVSPGQEFKHRIGPMVNEIYTHIGVVTAYRRPQGAQIMVARIPSGCDLKLSLGSNGILSFGEN